MKMTVVALAFVVLLITVGCGGEVEPVAETVTIPAPTVTETVTIPAVVDTSTPEAPEASEAAQSRVDPLLTAARTACEAGAAYGEALAAFVEDGPQESVASALDPLRVALVNLDAALSAEARSGAASASAASGTSQMQEAVADYTRANEGLTVLFTEGETAYQPVKARGLDADVLQDSGEEKWIAGAAQLFADEAPSAPTELDRAC